MLTWLQYIGLSLVAGLVMAGIIVLAIFIPFVCWTWLGRDDAQIRLPGWLDRRVLPLFLILAAVFAVGCFVLLVIGGGPVLD